MAEKINKNERKNKAEIITEVMNTESEDFLLHLGVEEHERKNLQIVVSSFFCDLTINKHDFTVVSINLEFYILILLLKCIYAIISSILLL